ncbi:MULTISPECIES: protein meaA [Methylosinus]|uniref:Protein meaA n=1 Tax=Methylosinus trichosporium (strain ATCC 35070 / NCIMB 11131 / UNIQEM 75 / OB3b) TaxID=595536 RepID=A0A2D2D4M8_METT3|nr:MULTISPECIES: protein meaA [Methylosinus]ATQ69936.1 protein meaA [Methylosinus trichosporium OB3b]OBS53847.1 protein meaA [Methylosinus sp. 3S-1]
MTESAAPRRDKPWLFRTYAGHSTAAESNRLYRSNLAKGQTGLSIAFDLPTQTGYDSDHILSRGEVGKVGVPVSHLGDMRQLFDGIPIADMNTSMTINATAVWLFALYIAAADEQGAPRGKLQGTTQNDIIKEYLSRGSYVFPPAQSLRLTQDLILFTTKECPKFNPMNVCSYHLQEAGATPAQELAYALATACAILDGVKAAGLSDKDFAEVVGRISFFVNAGMRFVTELCKMRAFVELWDEITRDRYGVTDEKSRRFRYGVQVNSLGLTEQQPENNVYRILIEALAVVLSKNARARAVQLPAWNEALGLPRPFDQQWSLRMQQIMAYETDLLEYGDIFDGNPAIAAKVAALKAEAVAELKKIDELGGAAAAVELGYMKSKLVESNTARLEAIEAGEQIVVGVNKFTEGEPSPLTAGDNQIMVVPEHVEAEQIARLNAWRAQRDAKAAQAALDGLVRAAKEGRNMVEPSIAAAKAGVTTGEWGAVLRGVFGEYRAPTGVSSTARQVGGQLDAVREEVQRVSTKIGTRAKFLVGKPGLDGHSNGAEQIAVRARDAGFDVIYAGIRSTPAELVETAQKEGAHCIGLSILSGSHVTLAHEVLRLMKEKGVEAPLVVGGIIPPADEKLLRDNGVAAVYTPKNYDLNAIMTDLAQLIEKSVEGRA